MIAEEVIREGLAVDQSQVMEALLDRVSAREVDPHSAAIELLASVK